MLILAGTIRLGAGKRDAALGPLAEMVKATRAEPGCREYSLSFDALDYHLVRIFEVFVDEAALAEHRGSPHMAKWRAAMPELGISGRDMSEYQVSSSRKI